MKVYAINGSPRKNKNTATLLQKALDGVKEATKDKEVETEIINLYDLNYTGCKSCFACKRLGGKNYGKCAINDDIYKILEKISQADGLIFGSPIYFSNITGQLLAFLERLLFPYLVYDKNYSTIPPKRMPTAFIYTMNVPENFMEQIGYPKALIHWKKFFKRPFTNHQFIYQIATYKFNNYEKYESSAFSKEAKEEHKRIQFPLDCKKAFELGVNLIK